jgi:hypothetical protein
VADRRVLRADPDDRRDRRQRELPGQVRLGAGSLRRERRSAEGGEGVQPEVGFLRRTDFTRSFGSARFSPRPKSSRYVRKYTSQASYEYYENGAGDVESRQATGRFNVELNNSDSFNIDANANYDLLLTPFSPAAGHVIPVGGYHYNDVLMSYNMGQQRRLSGIIGAQLGEYYNGTIKALTFSQGRYAILKQFSVEPRMSITRVDLPDSSFTTKQVGARTDYGFSPRMFASALLQYSSATTPSAAMCVSVGNTAPEASSSWCGPTSRTPTPWTPGGGISPSGTGLSSSR